MRKIILIIVLLFGIILYGQTTNCLTANGPDLLETKTQIKYGTPLCIEVSGVNTFLTKTYATYTPINLDFSTKGFLDIKLDEKNVETVSAKSEDRSVLSQVKINTNEISFLKSRITFNTNLMEKIATDSLSSLKSNETIISLLKSNAELENKIEILEKRTDELLKENKKLEEEIKIIKNVAEKSQLFKEEFINFQKHFSNIDKYTTLKSTLLKQKELQPCVQNFTLKLRNEIFLILKKNHQKNPYKT